MKFHIMTLFPDMIMNGLGTSIIGRAVEKGILEIKAWNIRDYAFNKHQSVDDYPYGGGAGMLMQAEPVYQTWKAICEDSGILEPPGGAAPEENEVTLAGRKTPRVVYLSPQGRPFSQAMAEEFAKEEELILLCGHYEGIDERVLEEIVTDYVSAGDYVLTGGELPAMMIVDAISRLIPGVLHNDVSAEFESFQDHLLEYPQYSRPEIWHDRQVPPILLSGHHANVEKWRREQSVIRTAKWRPDLLEHAELTKKEQELVRQTIEEQEEASGEKLQKS
ncbi:tRNA (guanosine(37)-N1)-methyltransferase TrmD [Roseburia hominis]